MIKRISIFAGIFLITLLFLAPPTAFASAGVVGATGAPAQSDAAQAARQEAAVQAAKDAAAQAATNKNDSSSNCGFTLNPVTVAKCILNTTVSGVVDIFVKIIDSVIGAIVKVFVFLAIVLVKWALDINLTITEPGSLAYFGWGLTLNFANLLFVVAIVAIAFGIMFRRAWAKKSLPRLILIALLINFSFFIAKELIMISDSITKVFLNTGTLNLGNFADFFTGAGNVNIDTSIGSALGKGISSVFFGPIAAIAFGFIAFLTILAIAVAFLVRYVSLTILLILLPLALGMSLLPIKVGKMPNAWQEWQDNFFKWLIFGPAMMFFIYLSFQLLGYKQSAPEGGFIQIFGTELGNYVAIIGILLGGLIVANKMGIAGASTFDGYIKKGQAWGEGMAKGGVRSMANRVLTAGARPGLNGVAPKQSHAQRLSTRLVGIPGLSGVAAGIGRTTQSVGRSVTETQEEFKSYNNDAFVKLVDTTKLADNAKKTAFAMELAKRNLTDKVSKSKLDELLESAVKVDQSDPTRKSVKTILDNRPDLAFISSIGMRIEDVMKKITNPNEISSVSFNATTPHSEEVTLNLSIANLTKLGNTGSDKQRDEIKATLKQILINATANPAAYTPQQTAAYTKIDDFVINNPNWQ
jgi:hypothetical protein